MRCPSTASILPFNTLRVWHATLRGELGIDVAHFLVPIYWETDSQLKKKHNNSFEIGLKLSVWSFGRWQNTTWRQLTPNNATWQVGGAGAACRATLELGSAARTIWKKIILFTNWKLIFETFSLCTNWILIKVSQPPAACPLPLAACRVPHATFDAIFDTIYACCGARYHWGKANTQKPISYAAGFLILHTLLQDTTFFPCQG